MNELRPIPVTIHLEKGARFEGLGWGDFSSPRGSEFVFCTAMSGIEESLTDPSFAAQTLVSTVAHVGNTGFTGGEDMESSRIWAEGLVCRNLETVPSNWRAKDSLPGWIVREKRYAVSDIDTRALTIVLREEGSQRGIVYASGKLSEAQAADYVRKQVPDMNGLDLTGTVTCAKAYDYNVEKNGYWPMGRDHSPAEASHPRIAVWDFGVKQNTLRLLKSLGAQVRVVPSTAKADELLAAGKDGILLSNGPGDPAAATHVIQELKSVLGRRTIFAICLGHQLIAHAAGGRTRKMKFGHRGIHHPVVELDRSGRPVRTWITSQNHGFEVDRDSLPKGVRVSFIHGDDESVEGLSLPDLRCETVQFHPEAAPGPFDAGVLLKRFMKEVAHGGA